jgi:hypothetical protein
MSEIELYRKLAQRPFEEVRLVVRDMNAKKMPGYKIAAALHNRGWTVAEYRAQHLAVMAHEIDLVFDKKFAEVDAFIESTK